MGKRTSDFLALAAIACGGGLAVGLTGLIAGTAGVAQLELGPLEVGVVRGEVVVMDGSVSPTLYRYRSRTRTMQGARRWSSQWQGLSNDVQEARVRATGLAREQALIEAEMDRVSEAGHGPGSMAGRTLFDRKEVMNEEIADLEEYIGRLASDAQDGRSEASDRLREAVATISDEKLKERVRYSRGLIGLQDREYTQRFEAETTRVVEELAEELTRASDAISENEMEFRPLEMEFRALEMEFRLREMDLETLTIDVRRDEEDQRRKRRRRRPRR